VLFAQLPDGDLMGGQSMMKHRILVVGNDMGLRAVLARWLIAAGYSVELAESARRAREVLTHERIGLAILATELPDGGDFARELRAAVDRLIVVKDLPRDSRPPPVQAVQADGYLAKPLREDDVLAQIGAALRIEADTAEIAAQPLRFAGYTLDAGGRNCRDAAGRIVALTKAERMLLLSLARQSGRVMSRDELTRAVAGREAQRGDRGVDVLISRLRRKIEADPKSPRMILTVPGAGYTLVAEQRGATDAAPASSPATEAAATGAAAPDARRPRQRQQRCPIRRGANGLLASRRWRVSPVSRSSF
jgi:DNA-binding response OmpR family regulator